MTRSSDPRFLEAVEAVNQALDDIDAPSMIIGGVAVIALGVARYTGDVDATIQGRSSDPDRVLKVFAQHDIRPRIEGAAEFARSRMVVLARHNTSGVSVDATLAWLPFEEEAIQFSQVANYSGIRIRVPRPEDLVVYKLVAGRPQDIDDVEKLLALFRPLPLGGDQRADSPGRP